MISSETRVAGPFNGNGVTTVFAFAFKVFSAADLVVIKVNSSGADSVLVLNTNYTVALNADQDLNPGGNITTIGAGSPLANGEKLFAYSDLLESQPAVLLNAGGWFPKSVENALDRATIVGQQASLLSQLAIRFPISEQIFPAELPKAAARAGKVIGFDGAGAVIAATFIGSLVTTVVGQIPFGGAANTLAQDSNLFWDNTNKRLGIGTGTPAQAIDVVGSVKASTSVFTPIVDSSSGVLVLKGAGATALTVSGSSVTLAGTVLSVPATGWTLGDNTAAGSLYFDNAAAGRTIITGKDHIRFDIIAGTEKARINSAGSLAFTTAATKIIPGATSLSLRNNADTANNLLVLDNGNAIFTGTLTSNGTFTTGTNPAIGGAIGIPYQTQIRARRADNAADINLIESLQQNTTANCVYVGGNTSGALLQSRSGGAAPGTADLPSGSWMVWRDTAGATTKLYYNNAGTIQSVALA